MDQELEEAVAAEETDERVFEAQKPAHQRRGPSFRTYLLVAELGGILLAANCVGKKIDNAIAETVKAKDEVVETVTNIAPAFRGILETDPQETLDSIDTLLEGMRNDIGTELSPTRQSRHTPTDLNAQSERIKVFNSDICSYYSWKENRDVISEDRDYGRMDILKKGNDILDRIKPLRPFNRIKDRINEIIFGDRGEGYKENFERFLHVYGQITERQITGEKALYILRQDYYGKTSGEKVDWFKAREVYLDGAEKVCEALQSLRAIKTAMLTIPQNLPQVIGNEAFTDSMNTLLETAYRAEVTIKEVEPDAQPAPYFAAGLPLVAGSGFMIHQGRRKLSDVGKDVYKRITKAF